MKLTKEEVKHIADLARLNLSEEEIARYQSELSYILEYIDQLQEVDTTGVEPTAQVTGLINRFREDVAATPDEATRQRLINAFPEREGNYDKVKAVFE